MATTVSAFDDTEGESVLIGDDESGMVADVSSRTTIAGMNGNLNNHKSPSMGGINNNNNMVSD